MLQKDDSTIILEEFNNSIQELSVTSLDVVSSLNKISASVQQLQELVQTTKQIAPTIDPKPIQEIINFRLREFQEAIKFMPEKGSRKIEIALFPGHDSRGFYRLSLYFLVFFLVMYILKRSFDWGSQSHYITQQIELYRQQNDKISKAWMSFYQKQSKAVKKQMNAVMSETASK